jgi:hypothetical protein
VEHAVQVDGCELVDAAPVAVPDVPLRITRAPAAARPRAISYPRPRTEPVTRAVRPVRPNIAIACTQRPFTETVVSVKVYRGVAKET